MTFSKTPIEMQLQRNSSIILKQKNIREYLPPESSNMLRSFEIFRNNSLLERNVRQNSDQYSFNKVRRHSSELLLGRPNANNRNLPNFSNPPVRAIHSYNVWNLNIDLHFSDHPYML